MATAGARVSNERRTSSGGGAKGGAKSWGRGSSGSAGAPEGAPGSCDDAGGSRVAESARAGDFQGVAACARAHVAELVSRGALFGAERPRSFAGRGGRQSVIVAGIAGGGDSAGSRG